MLRALVAEDEEMIRKGLVYTTDWLPMDCVVVVETADSWDGCEKVLEYRPDVIITDICMPFMNDIEMTKRASEQVRLKSVLLTSYADFEYTRRTIKARACRYLLRSVDEEALTSIMERLEEEIMNSRQVEHVMGQVEIGGGNLNLEYYMQLDSLESQYVSRAVKTIREDFTKKLNIESILDDLGVSTSYLSGKLKEVTGRTFPDFFNKYRVQQTIVILGIRQYRVNKISEATRFMGHKHFCSVSKKYTSKFPTKFIRGVS